MDIEAQLERLEAIVDRAAVAERIEALLPRGARPRQLSVRTLLIGMLLAAVAGRPAHLSRIHQALLALPEAERRRLGVVATWKSGEHPLTYRQVEHTFALVVRALRKEKPDGGPSQPLCEILDALLEASVQLLGEPASSSYAVDWTDLETWSRPPPKKGGECSDPEASWGHRRGKRPGAEDETFFGYHLQAATLVKDEAGPEVPELVRRIQLGSCHVDPPPAFVPVIERMHASGIAIGDALTDSGYAHRKAESWALPLRALGARLVHDLHPHDRGPRGTHMGAIRANGNLYCPATPKPLLELSPLAPSASEEEQATHDCKTEELARYKLARISGPDPDGYQRVACPAAQGKLRCPLRPESLTLPHDRPQVLSPPEQPPKCCRQKTITVPPSVNAKTAQKHDYPSRAHRRSYARRSAAERTNASVKDPAANDLSRGWCSPGSPRSRCLPPACSSRATCASPTRSPPARPTTHAGPPTGCPPKQRKRRRRTATDLVGAANAPP